MISKNRIFVGEIVFQMDRRIIEYIFAGYTHDKCLKKRRCCNFKEAVEIHLDGLQNPQEELTIRRRYDNVLKTLGKLGYNVDKHEAFLQHVICKYGILCGTPREETIKELGLTDPVVLREAFSRLIQDDEERRNIMMLLDCVIVLAYEDRRSLLLWY
jgi:hypothetical protein